MARMQKKKPAAQKKKKKEPGNSSVANSLQADPAEPNASATGVTTSAEAKSKKQKSAYSSIRQPAAGQTAVIRLLDRYFGNWIQFLREVRMELSKVTWPSRKETIGTTAVVLVFVFIVAIFLGVLDIGLSSLVRLIL